MTGTSLSNAPALRVSRAITKIMIGANIVLQLRPVFEGVGKVQEMHIKWRRRNEIGLKSLTLVRGVWVSVGSVVGFALKGPKSFLWV